MQWNRKKYVWYLWRLIIKGRDYIFFLDSCVHCTHSFVFNFIFIAFFSFFFIFFFPSVFLYSIYVWYHFQFDLIFTTYIFVKLQLGCNSKKFHLPTALQLDFLSAQLCVHVSDSISVGEARIQFDFFFFLIFLSCWHRMYWGTSEEQIFGLCIHWEKWLFSSFCPTIYPSVPNFFYPFSLLNVIWLDFDDPLKDSLKTVIFRFFTLLLNIQCWIFFIFLLFLFSSFILLCKYSFLLFETAQ